jgi:hypothetical protein
MSKPEYPGIGRPCNACGECCMTEVCSVGSYAMGLVDELGDRQMGRCPALAETGKGFECGVILRPRDWLKRHDPKVSVNELRQAMMTAQGIGTGCSSIGLGPEGPHDDFMIRQVQAVMMARTTPEQMQQALRLLCGGGQ